MMKIAVLASGNGSTLQAIIDACEEGKLQAEIVAVVCNKADAYALERAEQAGIPSKTFLRKAFVSNQEMDEAISTYLKQQQVQLVVLAGYMKILTPTFINHFPNAILNIHPSLLPKYPGLDTYARALQAGDKEHGTTVHFVNEEVDAGAIVLQAKVPIFEGDNEEDVAERVKAQERRIYPLVIDWFVRGRLLLREGKAYLDGNLLPIDGYAADE